MELKELTNNQKRKEFLEDYTGRKDSGWFQRKKYDAYEAD